MRQIDNTTPQELEMLHLKNMVATISLVEKAMQPKTEPMKHTIDQKRVSLFHTRIDACDTLLDYLHDDVAWGMQQPFQKVIEQLKRNLEDEMQDALTP